jgi:hypothetical protein
MAGDFRSVSTEAFWSAVASPPVQVSSVESAVHR